MEVKMNEEALNLRKRVGVNQYESRLYLALLTKGATSASDSANIADIPRPRAYDVLDKLEKRGLISSQPGRPIKFAAVPIEEAFMNLKKHKVSEHNQDLGDMEVIKNDFKKTMKDTDMKESPSAGDFVWVLKDSQNINSKIDNLLTGAQKHIYIATSEKKLKDKLDLFSTHLKTARDRGVEIKINSKSSTAVLKEARQIAHSVKSESFHRMMIVDNDVLLFLTPENSKTEVASWIRSPYFSESMRKLF